jgi:transposase
MDFHLDRLLDFPNMSIEKYTQTESEVHLSLRGLKQSVVCTLCGCETDRVNQHRPVEVRDLPILGKDTILTITRRQFKCEVCQKYFTEPMDFVDFERHSTQRYQMYIYNRVKVETVTQVARDEHLTYDRVKSIFDKQFKKTDYRLTTLRGALV